MVGPEAIGFTSLDQYSGDVVVNDATSAAYIQQITASATYDGFTVSGPHLLIQGVETGGLLDIYATQPVIIRGCRIRTSGGYWAVHVRSGAGPVYLLFSDVGGASATSGASEGIEPDNSGHNVFFRNHVSYSQDGFSIGSQNDQILENYVETFWLAVGAHNDGIQAAGNNDGSVVARNKIILNNGETGAINLGSWGGAVAQYVTIDSNYLAGGGWTFYGGSDGSANPATNHVVVTNNVFGFDVFPTVGSYGVGPAYWYSGNSNVWTNNTEADGTPVTP